MKKLVSIFCSLVILGMSALSCFAAGVGALTPTKDTILDLLKSGFGTTSGTRLYLPQEYLNQAENYLNANGDKLTENQYFEIIDQIYEAYGTISKTNATSFADLQKNFPETVNALKKIAQDAASSAGLKITFGEGKSVTITDSTGNVVFKTSVDGTPQKIANNGEKQTVDTADVSDTYVASQGDVIKTTGLGVNVTNAAIISSVIGLLLLASGAVIYNNKLFKHE